MTDTFKIDRPVSGDIILRDEPQVPQKTPQEFLSVVDELLALPGVTAIGWLQFTPHFNDGDACVFSVREINFRLDSEVFGDLNDGDAWGFPHEENWVSEYDIYSYPERDNWRLKLYEINGVSTEYLREAFTLWPQSAIEQVAHANFGDHARVIATSEGFDVEYLEHD